MVGDCDAWVGGVAVLPVTQLFVPMPMGDTLALRMPGTHTVETAPGAGIQVQRFRARVIFGADANVEAVSKDGKLTIGTAEGATLHVSDPTVSRFHLELEATADGVVVRDLGSTNGTMLGSSLVREMIVRDPVEVDLGRTRVRISIDRERTSVATSSASQFGRLIGQSTAMRAIYTVFERAAPTSAPVLLTGESGTGKELAAKAIHAASPRAAMPFEVVDCGGLPPTLIESELFGHERGAFTGAVGEREGAFERADRGTLFLDELGELPTELQPKLLRALGEGEVRRIGARKGRKVDVRVIAATNRDLRREVNSGSFRADLYYRLAVIQVRMPALRERMDDIPLLASEMLLRINVEHRLAEPFVLDEETLALLTRHTWPGNVRELRNYLDQLAILRHAPPLESNGPGERVDGGFEDLCELPMPAARAALLDRFERAYVTGLLARCDQNVAEAARRANVDRATLFRIIRRAGLRGAG